MWTGQKCALLLACLCVQAQGAGYSDGSEFKGEGICQFATNGFVPAARSQAAINQTVETLIVKHQETFGFRRQPGFRLRMRVFNTVGEFTNAAAIKGLVQLQGLYVSATKEILTYRQEIPESLGATLLHEASHAIMDEYYGHLQPWLSEGAAEYFAYSLARNPQNTAALQKRWAYLNGCLREGKLPELVPLLNANHRQWTALDPDIAYAASWSLFQFLMRSDANKRLVRTLLQEWQDTPFRRVDCAAQMQRLYPGGLKALEKEWHQWIDRADKGNGAAEIFQAAFRGKGICRFALRNYTLPANVESIINERVSRLVSAHEKIFGFESKAGFYIPVRIFGEFKDYAIYTTNALVSGWTMKPEELARVTGYYSPFSREVVALADNTPEHLAHTVVFLANNALLKETFAKLPQWVHSGSPDYFVVLAAQGNARQSLADAWERAGLRGRTIPPLRTILDDAARTWEAKGEEHRNEVLSWAVTQFLCGGRENQMVFRAVLTELQATPGARANCVPAFERHYPGGFAHFEIDFRRWAQDEGLLRSP